MAFSDVKFYISTSASSQTAIGNSAKNPGAFYIVTTSGETATKNTSHGECVIALNGHAWYESSQGIVSVEPMMGVATNENASDPKALYLKIGKQSGNEIKYTYKEVLKGVGGKGTTTTIEYDENNQVFTVKSDVVLSTATANNQTQLLTLDNNDSEINSLIGLNYDSNTGKFELKHGDSVLSSVALPLDSFLEDQFVFSVKPTEEEIKSILSDKSYYIGMDEAKKDAFVAKFTDSEAVFPALALVFHNTKTSGLTVHTDDDVVFLSLDDFTEIYTFDETSSVKLTSRDVDDNNYTTNVVADVKVSTVDKNRLYIKENDGLYVKGVEIVSGESLDPHIKIETTTDDDGNVTYTLKATDIASQDELDKVENAIGLSEAGEYVPRTDEDSVTYIKGDNIKSIADEIKALDTSLATLSAASDSDMSEVVDAIGLDTATTESGEEIFVYTPSVDAPYMEDVETVKEAIESVAENLAEVSGNVGNKSEDSAYSAETVWDALEEANDNLKDTIDRLDAEVESEDHKNVKVKVTEVNGVITIVNVTESYATVDRTAHTDATEEEDEVKAAISITDEEKLVVGEDLQKVIDYVEEKLAEETTGATKDVTANAGNRGEWSVDDNGNATLSENEVAPTISGVPNSFMDGAQAVSAIKTYVDAKVDVEAAEREAKIEGAVKALDATVSSETESKHVKIKIQEVDGKLELVEVTDDDIASEQTLEETISAIGLTVSEEGVVSFVPEEGSSTIATAQTVADALQLIDTTIGEKPNDDFVGADTLWGAIEEIAETVSANELESDGTIEITQKEATEDKRAVTEIKVNIDGTSIKKDDNGVLSSVIVGENAIEVSDADDSANQKVTLKLNNEENLGTTNSGVKLTNGEKGLNAQMVWGFF